MEKWKTATRFQLLHTHNYLIAPHTIIRRVNRTSRRGAFLHQTPRGKSVNYGTVWVVYHF